MSSVHIYPIAVGFLLYYHLLCHASRTIEFLDHLSADRFTYPVSLSVALFFTIFGTYIKDNSPLTKNKSGHPLIFTHTRLYIYIYGERERERFKKKEKKLRNDISGLIMCNA